MQRRIFMTNSIAVAALAPSVLAFAAPASAPPFTRHWFELRRYSLISGPQMARLTDAYLADALIPALNRLGLTPVGAFRVDIGPETPATYLLLPAAAPETLTSAPSKLAVDEAYLKAAAPFLNVSADRPAFRRVDSALLLGFPNAVFPPPAGTLAPPAKRVFQLRTYESPTPQNHDRKIEMFESGEYDIFHAAGFQPIFFGETVIGSRTPSLTYLLAFKDLADLDAKWNVFRNDPAWKKLNTSPRYSTEALVSNITNLVLTPTPYSQI